jgi:hypothetical protein
MPTAHVHRLVVPVQEGGEFVFAHGRGNGVRVWTRSLARRLPEPRSRVRHGAAPLYGGNLADLTPLRDFLDDCVGQAADPGSHVRLAPGRRNAMRLISRAGLESELTHQHFAIHVLSPLHTCGPWEGAAPELLLSRVRGTAGKGGGYFATGCPSFLPELSPTHCPSRCPPRGSSGKLPRPFASSSTRRSGRSPRGGVS